MGATKITGGSMHIRWDSDAYYRDDDHPEETKASFPANLQARHERAVARGAQVADLPSAD
jgi:hypothetical protein